MVAGQLDLLGEGKHVGEKPALKQGGRVDLSGGDVSGGLVEDRRLAPQHSLKDGNGGLVHRERHVFLPGIVEDCSGGWDDDCSLGRTGG